jgi:competence protein ComGF
MLLRIFLYSHIILILLSCSNKKIKINDSVNETIIFKKQLSKRINETSGLEYFDGNLITHNDSGGQPALYIFSTEGEIFKKIKVKNAKNEDWEDITMDDEYLFISDSGNNFGNRKNLKIIITDYRESFRKMGEINFSYAGQKIYKRRNIHPYDAEALISVNDKLVLFSKNRETLTTELFLIPKIVGNYELSSVKSFISGALITGADYDDKLKLTVLVGYDKIGNQYLFKLPNFYIDLLDQVQMKRLKLPLKGKQIEAIKIIDANTFWITSEDDGAGYPMLYKVKL